MKKWVNIKTPPMRKARIEIIPMIDTIFFLLVFFMFTSLSMVKMKGMDVSLPKDSTSTDAPPPQVVITINAQGEYYLNRDAISGDNLTTELQSRLNAKPNTVFIVNVAKQRQTQDIITVMDAVNDIHIPGKPNDPVGVMIATQAVNPGGPATP